MNALKASRTPLLDIPNNPKPERVDWGIQYADPNQIDINLHDVHMDGLVIDNVLVYEKNTNAHADTAADEFRQQANSIYTRTSDIMRPSSMEMERLSDNYNYAASNQPVRLSTRALEKLDKESSSFYETRIHNQHEHKGLGEEANPKNVQRFLQEDANNVPIYTQKTDNKKRVRSKNNPEMRLLASIPEVAPDVNIPVQCDYSSGAKEGVQEYHLNHGDVILNVNYDTGKTDSINVPLLNTNDTTQLNEYNYLEVSYQTGAVSNDYLRGDNPTESDTVKNIRLMLVSIQIRYTMN